MPFILRQHRIESSRIAAAQSVSDARTLEHQFNGKVSCYRFSEHCWWQNRNNCDKDIAALVDLLELIRPLWIGIMFQQFHVFHYFGYFMFALFIDICHPPTWHENKYISAYFLVVISNESRFIKFHYFTFDLYHELSCFSLWNPNIISLIISQPLSKCKVSLSSEQVPTARPDIRAFNWRFLTGPQYQSPKTVSFRKRRFTLHIFSTKLGVSRFLPVLPLTTTCGSQFAEPPVI